MDKLVVARVLSVMTFSLFGTLFFPMLLALFMEDAAGGSVFLLIMVITLIISFELKSYSHGVSKNSRLQVKDGVAITTFGWILISVLGMLPYFLSGELRVLDAFLESVSGFAGVGGTVATDVTGFSPAILLWRSLTNWIGGLGIILLFMAIIPQKGAFFMIKAENSFASERELPKVRNHAKAIFAIYAALTFLCFDTFVILGADAFSAVNHALTTVSTGGFSVFNDGLMTYKNPNIELAAAVFMIVSAVSFPLYLTAVRKGAKELFKSTELRAFLAIIVISTTLITLDLFLNGRNEFFGGLHLAFFHVASLSSTTAFTTDDFDTWPALSKGILLFLMFVGGCAGSTAGGVKIFRIVLLSKMIGVILRQKLHPQQIITAKMNGKTVPDEIFFGAARLFFATLVIDAAFAGFLILNGVNSDDSILVAISTMASVGPGFGIEGAMSNYSLLPDFAKLTAAAVMILGRLEIFTALVFFTRDFWDTDW